MSTTVCPHCGGQIELTAMQPRRQSSQHDPPRDRPPPREPPRERQPWEKPPQPWTLERARNFAMPFGKYKNRTIAQIWQVDRGYLEWAKKNLDRCPNAQKAAQVYLESVAEAAGTTRTNTGPSGDGQFDASNRPEQAPPTGGTGEFDEFERGGPS